MAIEKGPAACAVGPVDAGLSETLPAPAMAVPPAVPVMMPMAVSVPPPMTAPVAASAPANIDDRRVSFNRRLDGLEATHSWSGGRTRHAKESKSQGEQQCSQDCAHFTFLCSCLKGAAPGGIAPVERRQPAMVSAIEDRRLAGRAVALRIGAQIAKPNKFVAPAWDYQHRTLPTISRTGGDEVVHRLFICGSRDSQSSWASN